MRATQGASDQGGMVVWLNDFDASGLILADFGGPAGMRAQWPAGMMSAGHLLIPILNRA
jgi:hypothetical protein